MFDAALRKLIDPPLDRAGRWVARTGVSADGVTLMGLALGLGAAALIGAGRPGLALVPLLLSRLMDGLDGAVARATRRTDFGGYLDIACDFAFYGAVPLAFAVLDPGANALAAAFLLFAFYVNGTTFLGLAVMAARAGVEGTRQGLKSLHYSSGLLEGTETIAFLVAICIVPTLFVPLAWVFGALCLVTAVARLAGAWTAFR